MAQVLYDAEETATLREDDERPLGTEVALKNAVVRRRRVLQSSPRDRTVTDEHPNAHDRPSPGGRSRERIQRDEVAVEALRYAEEENPKTNALLTISSDRALEGGQAR